MVCLLISIISGAIVPVRKITFYSRAFKLLRKTIKPVVGNYSQVAPIDLAAIIEISPTAPIIRTGAYFIQSVAGQDRKVNRILSHIKNKVASCGLGRY